MNMNKPDQEPSRRRAGADVRLLEKVRKTIDRYGLVQPGNKVLIAYSGGPDSTALLEVLLRLRDRYNLRLALAHFNHLLRSASAGDEEFAAGQAQRLGLPFYLGREDIRAYASEARLNLEEAGRQRRYEFLKTTAARVGANRIATGHTMTDQAETVILRILRGTGPAGLAGISPSVAGLIIRPLLEVERDELETWLRTEGITWREDESNRDRRFLRNRVRLDLIPYLKKDFEPTVVRQLSRLADICREEEAFLRVLDQKSGAAKASLVDKDLTIDAVELAQLPVAAGRRVVRDFLRRAKGDLRRLSYFDIEAVRLLGEHKEHSLPGGPILRRDGGRVRISAKRESAAPAAPPYHHLWDGRGTLKIEESGAAYRSETRPVADARDLPHDDASRAHLDADKVEFPLIVRPRKDGDRYQPLGSPGRKKLKEIMRARGVPLEDRDRLPVFLAEGKIVWVPGLPVAEGFKVTPTTKNLLIIRKT
jgi:tRNA(Ile)-lysidine synthase